MGYKLEKDLPLKRNITEITCEEINGCLQSVAQLGLHEAVHDIRKRFKKLRALARLVRDELGEEKFKEINVFYRNLGRELATFRDLSAHLETLELLQERYGSYLYVRFFKSIRKIILEERDSMEAGLLERNFFNEYLVNQLETAKKNLVDWPIGTNDIHVILPGINRVYKRGRKAMKRAYQKPTAKNFHEWRKRVKYLWYQILLLQETWPQLFGTFEEEIHQLSDLLGDDHDLMILQHKINDSSFGIQDATQVEIFNGIAREYSASLRENAKRKGELIYAEKPGDFTRRMAAYTQANWK